MENEKYITLIIKLLERNRNRAKRDLLSPYRIPGKMIYNFICR